MNWGLNSMSTSIWLNRFCILSPFLGGRTSKENKVEVAFSICWVIFMSDQSFRQTEYLQVRKGYIFIGCEPFRQTEYLQMREGYNLGWVRAI